jgi:competence protein ComEC
VALTVLGPDSAWTAAQEDANEASVVVLVQFGLVRILLTGDAEGGAEGWLVRRWGDTLAADVLKLGHHGSRTSSTPGFLDAVGPRLGLVSVGAGNRYRHPSAEVVAAFTDRGVPLLRTDEDGTVVLRTDGRRIDVDGRGGRWTLP